MKADYAVAQAADYGGTGDALLRAQDKIATMQARAGATDELLQSGVLEDVGGNTDDIQEELDKAATAADVDSQLAALKAKIAAAQPPPELPPVIHRPIHRDLRPQALRGRARPRVSARSLLLSLAVVTPLLSSDEKAMTTALGVVACYLVGDTGLEPVTSSVSTKRSSQTELIARAPESLPEGGR